MSSSEASLLKKWFSDLLDWLLNSDIGKEEKNTLNNHAIAYDVICASYAIFVGRENIYLDIMNKFNQRVFDQIEVDGSQPLELARTTALHYSLFNLGHILDLSARSREKGINIYEEESQNGKSIGKAVEFLAQYLGKPQSAFPYQQISDWDKKQEELAWLLKRVSNQFQPNPRYDELFDQFCTTANNDKRWLLNGY